MQAVSRTSLFYHTALALIAGGGVGFVGAAATPVGWWLGIPVFAVAFIASLRKPLRRMSALRRDLTTEEAVRIDEIAELFPGMDRNRFEQDVRIVVDEWGFEGIDGVVVTDRIRVGVAAGAALLLHGRPEWELPVRQTVLLYPDRFDADYLAADSATFDGMAHQRGPIILSAPAIEESWANVDDGHNVVLHELAHLLDYENEFADGVPSLIHPNSAVAWRDLVEKEMRRIRLGRSVLRRYGAKNPAEFFAVSVENFFERPGPL
ncbi:MAG: M90 family metallopeptidase, partial [Rhodothermales bacterium]